VELCWLCWAANLLALLRQHPLIILLLRGVEVVHLTLAAAAALVDTEPQQGFR
jgi:hypothetical protein